MNRFLLWFFIIGFSISTLKGQGEPEEGSLPGVIMIDLAYAFQLPGGAMQKDFGYNFNLATRVGYLTPKNWIFTLNGEAIFSDKVKTDVLAPLRLSNGDLLTLEGKMGLTQLGQRGFVITGHVGHLVTISKKERRHNLEFRLGGGYLEHWVRIRLLNNPKELPQLFEEYKKGYDRRTAGLALQQYVGYRYMGRNKLVNLFIGFDFTQGFTYNQRGYNFDTREVDDQLHIDLLMGIRAGFTIPFYIYSLNTRTDDVDFY